MKTNKKSLSIVLFALIAVIVLGVGYAAISAINLTINGNATATPSQSNFTVKFMDDTEHSFTTYKEITAANGEKVFDLTENEVASVTGDLLASFSTQELSAAGDEAIVIYTIKNTSPDLKADIVVSSTNSNSEYFQVTNVLGNNDTSITLTAGATTTVTVKVKVLKTPITADQNTTVVTTITATPNNE